MGSLGQGNGLVGKKKQVIDGKIVTYPKPTAVNSYTLPLKATGPTSIMVLADSITDNASFDSGVTNIANGRDNNFGTAAQGIASFNNSSVSGHFELTYNVAQSIQQIRYKGYNDPSTNVIIDYFNGAWQNAQTFLGGATRDETINITANNVTKVRAIMTSGTLTGAGTKTLLLYELQVISSDAGKSIDNNNATEYETASMLTPDIKYEMSAAVDKKPSAFYCRLGNNTNAEAIALELSTDEIVWDRFNEFVVGADLIKGQDSFVEINLPTKDYRYYRWKAIDTIARILAIAETRFFVPTTTQIQYEHGHKKLF